jgi:hypothetical protein
MSRLRWLATVLAAIVVCACSGSTGGQSSTPAATAEKPATTTVPFGRLGDTPVQLYTLTNKNGLVAKITNYGATVTELHVPDRAGTLADVVLGFEDLDGYRNHTAYFGTIVGRVANRIMNAGFELEGRRYPLAANDPPHHLHGGRTGWNAVVWNASPIHAADGPALELTYVSRDGEEGYPGDDHSPNDLHADQRQRAQGRHAGHDRQDDAREHGPP